jgi:chorismate lyase
VKLIFQLDPALHRWLQAKGSLTARLRCFGEVRVLLLRQGPGALWPLERADLHQRCGYVREVVLLVNGRPAVWARSATSLAAITGPWRAMQGLGTRPLAELLFAKRQVRRAPLQLHHLPRHGLMHNHMRRQWQAMAPAAAAEWPHWARSSVFWHQGHALRVMEAFSPWVRALK